MNFNDLKLFISTVEYESITKAAAINNTVQSNVSARIKSLENGLGVKLLHRSTRKIEPTQEGMRFLRLAKEVITSLDAFRAGISSHPEKPRGLIKIGCIHSTAALRAPGILQNFTAQHPDIDFKLKTGTSSDLLKEVLAFKLDGAFVAGDVSHPDLAVQSVLVEELCLVSSSVYPTLDRLKSSTKPVKVIVFSKGCSYRALLEQVLMEMKLEKLKFVELDTLDGIINSVEDGIGITLLPVELIKRNHSYRNLVTFALPKRFPQCRTVFIKRKDYPMSESYKLFFDAIIEGYLPVK